MSLEPSLWKCFDSKDPTIMQMSDVTTALPPLSFNLEMKAYAQHQPHRISILHDLVYLYIKSRRGWLHVSIRWQFISELVYHRFWSFVRTMHVKFNPYSSPFILSQTKKKGDGIRAYGTIPMQQSRMTFVYLSTWLSACHRSCPPDVPYLSSVATIGCTWSTCKVKRIAWQRSLNRHWQV